MRRYWIACAMLVLMGGFDGANSSPHRLRLATIHDELSAVAHLRVPVAERVEKMNAIYDAHAAELRQPQAGMNDDDLRELFGSVDILAAHASFSAYERSLEYTNALVRVLEEMRRRSLATPSDYTAVVGALIATREFDRAHSIMERAPPESRIFLPRMVLPAGFDELEPSGLTWRPRDSVLEMHNVDLRLRNRIVVVGGCHIARGAIEDITSNPRLKRAFVAGNALWLEPAGRELDLAAIEQWDTEFPEFPMLIAYRHASWRGIDFSRSPSFYFFRDGELIASHQGWQSGQVPEPVEEALEQMQLL